MSREASPTRWREALSTFERLQALDAASQQRDLEVLRSQQPELHTLVQTLLRADSQAQSQDYLAEVAVFSTSVDAGASVGPYRLERALGSGGMGEVWLARRADGVFETPVALKLLHGHLARSAARERFVREGRILGTLAHPNIARLLDAGVTPQGQMYLALEYVEGDRLDRFCDAHELGIEERLKLVQQVCAALAHAHAHLVVHRDVKPSNILVTAGGDVKLLDFGIAKLVENQTGGGETELTRLGGRALTPEYAAPEQIIGATITVATDVYALGVLLYLLLTGHRPYGAPGAPQTQIEREVLESEPLPPSQRAASRKIADELKGDLDVIVGRALKKKPGERYPTIAALSEDLRRYLDHEPVLARPDSLTYRARKYLRRHRVGAAAAAAVSLAIVAGVAGTLWQAQLARASALRAQAESTRAQAEAGRATAIKDFLISVFRASDPRVASERPRGAITAKELLDLGAARIEKEFAGQPELQIELLGLTSDIYESGLADEERYAALQKRRIELARAHYGPAHPIVLEGLLSEVRGTLYRLDYAKAAQLLDEIDALLRTSGQDRSLLRAKWWASKWHLIHASDGNRDDMDLAQQESLALYRQLAPNSSDHGYVLSLAARSNGWLGDYAQARRFSEQALAVIEAAPDRDDAALPVLLMQHAGYLEQLGDFTGAESAYERAEAMARKTVGERHGSYWEARANHANLLHQRGERERAHLMFDEMLPTIPSDWKTGTHDAWVRGVYGDCLVGEGRPGEAIPLFEAGLRTYAERPFGLDGLIWLARLALAYDGVGRTAEARDLLKKAVEQALASIPEARLALTVRERWASFLLDHTRPGDADFKAAEAEFLAVLEKVGDRPWLEAARAQAGLARIAIARGDAGKALEQSRLALAALDRVQEVYDLREQPQIWLVHSAALRAAGDVAGARQWARRALEASTRYDHPTAESIKRAKAALQ